LNAHTAKTLEYALKYARRGWRVIWSHWPIGSGATARCSCGVTDIGEDGREQHSVGKHPGRDWVNAATTKEAVIRAWFAVKPDANLSIVTGEESGIFVLDIDPRSGGEQTISDLTEDHGLLPDTPTFFTGSGGFHLLFKHPGGYVPTKSEIGPGLDIRGNGGQIIAPPSRNINGYYTEDPEHPIEMEVAEAPAWLLALISASSVHDIDPRARRPRFNIEEALRGSSQGSRDQTIFRLAAKMRDEDIPLDMALDWIRRAAQNCNPPFPIKTAEEKVHWAYNKYEPRVDWSRDALIRKEAPRQVGRNWVQPYPLGAPTGRPLPEGVFPPWLDRYVSMVAKEIQVPTSMVATIALSTISACVAKKGIVRITPSWKETLNLYTVVACPPSSRKSPTFLAVAEPVFDYQRRMIEEYEPRKASLTFEREGLRMRLERLKKEFAKGNNDVVPPEVAQLQQRVSDLENVDIPRLVADDVTPEKLAGLLFRNRERIAILSADGNDVFKQMGAKYSNLADPTLYIKGWSGDTKIVDRVGRPSEFLHSPLITLSLAVQPKVMRGVARAEAADQGLLARILYCFPEDNVGKRKIDFDPYHYDPNALDFETKRVYISRLRKLLKLPIPDYFVDMDGRRYDGVNVLAFDDVALQGFLEFERSLEEERGRTYDDDKREWLGKLGGNIARVIGLLHLVENIDNVHPDPSNPDSLKYLEEVWRFPIMVQTVEAGVKLGEWFMSHAAAAFEEMQSDPIKNHAIVLVKWIREKELPSFYKNEAIQRLGTAGEKAAATLTFLTERGYIRTSDENASLFSRDNLQFEVNPTVLSGDFRSIDDEDAE
jgi:replicative DNA helicase